MIYDVKCDGCHESYHRTTGGYDGSRPAKGSDFVLKDPWKSAGWSSFPENEDYEYGSLLCPGCGVSYANGSGFPALIPRAEEHAQPDPVVCDECGSTFKTERGLGQHMKKTHGVS